MAEISVKTSDDHLKAWTNRPLGQLMLEPRLASCLCLLWKSCHVRAQSVSQLRQALIRTLQSEATVQVVDLGFYMIGDPGIKAMGVMVCFVCN